MRISVATAPPPTHSSRLAGLPAYYLTRLRNVQQTAIVSRYWDQYNAYVPGPPPVSASGATPEEAESQLEHRVNLYA